VFYLTLYYDARKHKIKINYKIVPVTIFNKYFIMEQMEMNNMYINMGVNNGSKKWTKNTAASGKLIKAVYGLYVCVYMLCAS